MEQTSSHSPTSNRTRRKGQALAEFALTLPILLLLIFAIVEFGRAFQAWVTIQNAARAAARFASIGSVNYNIFIPDNTLPENLDEDDELLPQDLRVQNTIVPCVDDLDGRGTKGDRNGTEIYEGGKESFFATWYDGTDCDPANEDHQQFRKDILRVVSVMNEAREASSSLLVEANRYQGLGEAGVQELFYDVWTTPRPGNHLEPRYFDVMVCSSRIFLDAFSTPAAERFNLSRFITVRNERDKSQIGGVMKKDYPYPVCMLNEIPPAENPDKTPRTDQLTNAGVRWLDAGGPGERVTISIAFNHPLVTPLFNQQYVFMEARRSIVNESFRAPRAVGAFQRSLPPGSTEPEAPPPTDTATATHTPTETNTATATYTNTYTPTPTPFDCDKITAEWDPSPFVSDTFFMVIRNGNVEQSHATELTRTRLEWNALDDFKAMYLQTMSLEDLTYWAGPNGPKPVAQQPQTVVDTRTDPTFYPDGRIIGANSSARWKGYFRNGPTNLSAYFQLWDFDAIFEFSNPEGGPICTIVLQRPERPEPTITLTPSVGPPPTNTPNCATLQQLSLTFGGFQTRGVVYFDLANNSTRPTSITGFSLVWPDATHPQINLAANSYRLTLVTVGGDGPSDTATVPVWQAASATQDSVGNKKTTIPYDFGTVSTNGTEGQWLGAAIINPGTTRIYLDFEGVGLIGRLSDAPYNHRSWHYHQPVFRIGCNSSGSGGTGPGQNGDIGLPLPSPAPTQIPAPTPTPGPTKPPTATTKPPTAGPSRTPAPATKTPTPAPPTARPSNTPFGQPTQKPGSGGE